MANIHYMCIHSAFLFVYKLDFIIHTNWQVDFCFCFVSLGQYIFSCQYNKFPPKFLHSIYCIDTVSIYLIKFHSMDIYFYSLLLKTTQLRTSLTNWHSS